MSSTTLIWTALPRSMGASGGAGAAYTLSLTAFVSPRLTTGDLRPTTLSEFPAWKIPWPTTVARTALWVWIYDPVTLTANRYPARITNSGDEALDATLWEDLFPQSTPVNPYGYTSFSDQTLQSYPVKTTAQFLETLYRDVAITDPVAPHPIASQGVLYSAVGRIRHFAQRYPDAEPFDVVDEIVRDVVELPGGGTVEDHREDLEALVASYQFFARDRGQPDDFRTRDPIPVWDPDFHEMVAALGDAPSLLRRLGFVVDLQVDVPAAALVAEGQVYIEPSLTGVSVSSPRTQYEAELPSSGNRPSFLAASRSGEIRQGFLDLGRDEFFVHQMDVDGASLKVVNHAANVYQSSEAFPDYFNRDPDETSTLPSPVSKGLAVAREFRTDRLQEAFEAQDAIDAVLDQDSIAAVPLYWEDILRGYRVDVETNGTFWQSLCLREVEYTVRGTVRGAVRDEGYVKRASATHDEVDPERMFLHEEVFEWGGWSLAAARPGLVLNPQETLDTHDNAPATALDLQTRTVAAPGTLPRLRFATTYRIKARAVDLAGNSIDLNARLADGVATQPYTYRRYEPIPQPALVYRDPITEGEWIENLVIRSDRDVPVADYSNVARSYNPTCERHVAPPKAHLFLCEQHGAFDAEWASEGNAHQQSYSMAVKEGGTFFDEQVWDSDQRAYEGVTLSFWAHPDTPIADPRSSRGDPLGEGVYVTHPDREARLPYLPDPAALGIVLYDPATGDRWSKSFVHPSAYETTWPELPMLRLVCMDETSSAVPVISETESTLDVRLPQATILTLQISSEMLPARRDHFQIWHDIQGQAAAVDAANQSIHALLTPRRTVTFVHAVQRPLEDPISGIVEDGFRGEGQTWSTLRGDIQVHGRSTSQLDVMAVWTEVVDDVNDPNGPTWVVREANVGQLEVAYDQGWMDLPTETEDTANTTKPLVKHEHGDTKHRRVTYFCKATTRYREYFPERVWRDEAEITVVEDPLLNDDTVVLNTARPIAPRIRMVVPAFRWERDPDGLVATRHGNRLRVYLDRPWYTTGQDERLGVLFTRTGPEPRSEWGADPVRRRDEPTGRFRSLRLLNALGRQTMADSEGVPVDVSLFEVQYDPEQRLHFADIEIDTEGAYMPMMRLELARVQPSSVVQGGLDLRVSESVRTEWIQPVPTRRVSVTRTGVNEVHVMLSGVASGETFGTISLDAFVPDEARATRHNVCVRVERNEQGRSDLAWEPSSIVPALLSPYRATGDALNTHWRGFASVKGASPGGPDLPANGGTTWRLSVYEIELYPSDEDTAGPVSGFTVPRPPTDDRADYEADTGASGRVVSVIHLPIPS